jgi:hypothetical protein
MKVLVAVESCHKNRKVHDIIRGTWGKDIDFADLKFFLGFPAFSPEADEVSLAVPDDYVNLCYKTYAIIKYAYESGYDYLFKADTDTFVVTERLKRCGFENHEYQGLELRATPWSGNYKYAHGGAGYWLSRKILTIIAGMLSNEFCESDSIDKVPSEGTIFPEDAAVGRIAGRTGFVLFDDRRFAGEFNLYPKHNNDIITTHHMQPDQIRAVYRYFYDKVDGEIHISRGTLIKPGVRYIVRDKRVYEVDERGNIIEKT